MKALKQNDDFEAMREVIKRRYSRIDEEKNELPDLIIIDGGKGQLSSAITVLKDLNVYDKVKIIGLAKRLEEIFVPDEKESILLPRVSSSLRLIQHLRDEAHRFAITYHRTLRSKRTLKTELTDIKGIGPKTAQKLLIEFGSIKKIRESDLDKLAKSVGEITANRIINHYKNDNDKSAK